MFFFLNSSESREISSVAALTLTKRVGCVYISSSNVEPHFGSLWASLCVCLAGCELELVRARCNCLARLAASQAGGVRDGSLIFCKNSEKYVFDGRYLTALAR